MLMAWVQINLHESISNLSPTLPVLASFHVALISDRTFPRGLQCSAQKEKFQDLNNNFPQTFRYAGGSYQEVARKPDNSEVPDSRYKAKLNCRLRLNSTWMEDRNLRVLMAWVDIKLLESKANLSPPSHSWFYVSLCPSQI